MSENREIPESPLEDGARGRSEKALNRTSDMHDPGKSDDLIVPAKQTNKVGSPAAESVEGSGSTKGNAPQTTACRTQSRSHASSGLRGVRMAARRSKEERFTALLHHITPELLLSSYEALRPKASPGIDGVTWQTYGENLENNLRDLHERMHSGRYRAKPSKRAWIPKADGRRRPLGIAALEDKVVQQATKTVLEQIYEEDFLGFSYGFRPGRSQHDALDALWVGLTQRKIGWVLDADIRGFFDTINHAWMKRFIEHRIADRRIQRLIAKWLRAGVSDDGKWERTTEGTRQGAVISPLLANVYLHYVFDLWANHWRKTQAQGDVIIVRYCDDFVVGFQHKTEAERFLRELQERLHTFELELNPDKTRLIEFGRFAASNREQRGQGKPETFDFLGFTHCCSKTRHGWFTLKRYSIAKRFRLRLRDIKEQLRKRMHLPLHTQGRWLRAVVQGWYNYHAVPGNIDRLEQFRIQVTRIWLRTLRRRSQKGRCWNWEHMAKLSDTWLPYPRILHPYPNQRLRV